MPTIVTQLIEDWFCLPEGPYDTWVPGRLLSTTEHSSLSEQRKIEKISSMNPPAPPLEKKSKSMMNFLQSGISGKKKEIKSISIDKKFNNSLFTSGITKNEISLLKVRVQRGQVGRNGKVEYDVCLYV